jgi:MFS family permease
MIPEKNWHKFPVLFSLYIAQSIPMSFFSTVVPVIMRQESYSLESIGLLQLIKLPWILKFLWAPFIDNQTKTTRQIRQWIFGSEIFYALVILHIGFFNLQTDFTLIISLMVLAFVSSATQDIAVDIYAIFVLKKEERGLGNSMQSAGSFVGSLIGTGVLLIVYYYFGWRNLLILLAAFVAFAVIPLLLYRKKLSVDTTVKKKVSLRDVYYFFTTKGRHKDVLILVFYYSGIIGILAMLKPYMVDLGYNAKEIGFMAGIFGTAVAATCAMAAGFVIKKLGRNIPMYLFVGLSFIAGAYFWILTQGIPSHLALYAGIGMLWGAYGFSTVAIYTISMDRVRAGREGTDFTLQIVITHLSGLIIAVMSGKVGDMIGYKGLFGIEAMLSLFTFLILIYALPKRSSYAYKS